MYTVTVPGAISDKVTPYIGFTDELFQSFLLLFMVGIQIKAQVSLHFTSKSPGVPVIQLINLRRIKG